MTILCSHISGKIANTIKRSCFCVHIILSRSILHSVFKCTIQYRQLAKNCKIVQINLFDCNTYTSIIQEEVQQKQDCSERLEPSAIEYSSELNPSVSINLSMAASPSSEIAGAPESL